MFCRLGICPDIEEQEKANRNTLWGKPVRVAGYGFFWFLLLTLFSPLRAQVVVEGTIADSALNPIPFVQIVIRNDSSNRVVTFSQADSKGYYRTELCCKGRYRVCFQVLGYQPFIRVLEVNPELQRNIRLDVGLKTLSYHIDEVVAYGELPIVVKKDTVVYKVARFLTGNEDVVEDVLKRLPGIEVSDDGNVSFKGKEVEKIMVEGDDLFGKGYRIISRNLSARMIDRVEAYEHYSENPLLKQIEESDKVALNLRLSESAKYRIVGKVNLGGTNEGKYLGSATLMNFTKKFKTYLLSNANTVGYDPIGGGYRFLELTRTDGEGASDKTASSGYPIVLNNITPNLASSRVVTGEARMASLNEIISITPALKLSFISVFSSHLKKSVGDRSTTYLLGEDSFTTNESNVLRQNGDSYLLKTVMDGKLSSNCNIKYTGIYTRTDNLDNSVSLFNSRNLSQHLDGLSGINSHSFTYTRKTGSNGAWMVNSSYLYEHCRQNYQVNPVLFGRFFSDYSRLAEALQYLNSLRETADVSVARLYRMQPTLLVKSEFGATFRKQHFYSLLTFYDSLGNSFAPGGYRNDSVFFDNLFYSGVKVVKNTEHFTVDARAKICRRLIRLNGRETLPFSFTYIEPAVIAKWKFSKSKKVTASYAYTFDWFDGYKRLAGAYVLTGFREFAKGNTNRDALRGHLCSITYTQSFHGIKQMLFASVIYRNDRTYLSEELMLSPELTFSHDTLLRNRTMVLGNFTFDIYLSKLVSNIKLKGSYSYMDYVMVMNGEPFHSLSKSVMYGSEIRSAFQFPLNYHVGIMRTDYGYGSSLRNRIIRFFTNIDVRIMEELTGEVKLESYSFAEAESRIDPLYFFDFSLRYRPNRRFTVKLSGKNLFNNGVYRVINMNEYTRQISRYRLVARYLLLSFGFRF